MTRQPKSMVPKVRFKGFTDEWEQRKLGEMVKFSKGKGYSKSDLSNKGFPIILYGRMYTNYETEINNVDTFVQKQKNDSLISNGGEVIVPASGETAEDISVASVVRRPGVIIGGDLNILYANRFINPIFLALAITYGNAHRKMAQRAQGKSIVHLHNSDLANIKLIFPSIDEQSLISNFLKKVDKAITLQQRKLDQLNTLKKGLLQKMFADKKHPQPELRFKGFSGDWEQHKLGNISNRLDNLRVPVTASKREKGNTPYYGANGIQDYVSGFTHDGQFVLIAEDGANDVNNYPIRFVTGKIWVNNHAHVLQGKIGSVDNKFLTNAIKKVNISTFLVGGSRAKLNADVLMKIKISIPTMTEQIKIGTMLSKIDNLIALQQSKLDKLNSLKKSLLQNMFI